MEEHVDMSARETHRGGDVLAGAFFEQAHHHYRALGLAEAVHAAAQADALLGVGHQRFHGRVAAVRFGGVDGIVGASEVMTTALVSGGVHDDAGKERRVLGQVGGELTAEGQLEKRAEGVVDAVDGVFGAQPLASSDAGELRALLANDASERVEDVFFVVGEHPLE
jgi:hypothetical protein